MNATHIRQATPAMKIIDAFCGAGPWAGRDPSLPYRPEDLLALLDHFHIDEALVHPNVGAPQPAANVANAALAEVAGRCNRFHPAFLLGASSPSDPTGPEPLLASMREAQARAAWALPARPPALPGYWRWNLGDTLDALAQRKVPLFVTHDTMGAEKLDDLCSNFPRLVVVLVGVDYAADPWLYPLLRRHPLLHVCLGHFYIPSDAPDRFVRTFGAERLLFGSGLPHYSPGGLLGMVAFSQIAHEDKQRILGGNIERLLGEAKP